MTNNKMIPKIIHQIWWQGYEHAPPKEKNYMQTVKDHHSLWTIYHWDETSITIFMKTNFSEYWDMFQQYPHMIQKIDVAKYFILYYFGGFYIDADMKCIKPLDKFLKYRWVLSQPKTEQCDGKTFCFWIYLTSGSKLSIRCVNNGFIGCTPKDAVWIKLFKLLRTKCCNNGNWNIAIDVQKTTGPFIFTEWWDSLKLDTDNDIFIDTSVTIFEPCGERFAFTGSYNDCNITDDTHFIHDFDMCWLGKGYKAYLFIKFNLRSIVLVLACIMLILFTGCILYKRTKWAFFFFLLLTSMVIIPTFMRLTF